MLHKTWTIDGMPLWIKYALYLQGRIERHQVSGPQKENKKKKLIKTSITSNLHKLLGQMIQEICSPWTD